MNGYSANAHSIDASSTSATGVGTNNDVFAFAGMRNAGDSQEINVSLTDAGGSQHAIAVTLSKTNAGDIDKAISTLNTAAAERPEHEAHRGGERTEQGRHGGRHPVRQFGHFVQCEDRGGDELHDGEPGGIV